MVKLNTPVSIDLSLELEIARKIFGRDFACAVFEVKRSVEGVIDLFNEGNKRANIMIAQPGTRIVPLKLFDQPTGIINADVKAIVGRAEKSPGELAQFARGFAGQDRQLASSMAIGQTTLKIDSDPGVSSLEKFLDLAERRIVHKRSDGRTSSSR